MAITRLGFGKYSKRPLNKISTSYLRWLVGAESVALAVRNELLLELDRREKGKKDLPPPELADLVRRWGTECLLKYHPRKGFSIETFEILKATYTRLQEILGL